jgi:hypothetical protein
VYYGHYGHFGSVNMVMKVFGDSKWCSKLVYSFKDPVTGVHTNIIDGLHKD